MRTSQITITDDRAVHVSFSKSPCSCRPSSMTYSTKTSSAAARASTPHGITGWLSRRESRRHLATENIRSQLVKIGFKPYGNRKAILFQLAGDMPRARVCRTHRHPQQRGRLGQTGPHATRRTTWPSEPADRRPARLG